jgi:hypothetical protein
MSEDNSLDHYFDWTTYSKSSLEFLLKDFKLTKEIMLDEYMGKLSVFYLNSNFIKWNRYIREIEHQIAIIEANEKILSNEIPR